MQNDIVKPKRKYIRGFFKNAFNVKKWIFYEQIATNANVIVDSIKKIYSLDKRNARVETFEEAVARMQLTEEQLNSRKKYFFWYSLFYAGLGVVLLMYGYYMFDKHTLAAFFCIRA